MYGIPSGVAAMLTDEPGSPNAVSNVRVVMDFTIFILHLDFWFTNTPEELR